MKILDKIKKVTLNNISVHKSTEQLVREIHEDFFTEVDKLLADAKISRSLETSKQELIEKSKRLQNLGFSGTKEVLEANEELLRIKKLEDENKLKIDLIQAIEYFSIKYPQYKFITEESVIKICEKYGLIYGEVSKYKGIVPDKNLKQMEEFQIDKLDQCCLQTRTFYHFGSKEKKIINYNTYLSRKDHNNSLDRYEYYDYTICPLEIAGPAKDFYTDGMQITNFKLEEKIQIPDPVVLQPVFYKDKKYFLIVTAWGLEAYDENVVNHKMN